MTAPAPTAPEELIRRIGHEIAGALPRHRLGGGIDRQAIERIAANPALKAALFRFVDVVPAARSRREAADHLDALLAEADRLPPPLRTVDGLARRPATAPLVGRTATWAVRRMARQFILAEDVAGATGGLTALWDEGAATALDLLGEASVSEAEADAYAARCLDALERLDRACRGLPARPRLDGDGAGPLPRAHLSVKLSALTPRRHPFAPERVSADAKRRLRPIARRARELGAHLHLDSESLDSREAVLTTALELLAEPEFATGPSAGVVLQAYLRDADDVLDRLLAFAATTPGRPPLLVRLVKGAYWDHEVVDARQHGWTPAVHDGQAATDRAYEALTRRLLGARPTLRVAIASHNLRSIAHAVAHDRHGGGDGRDLELQVLLGLGDDLRVALARRDLRVRVYCPVGDLVAGMAYLVRRLLENTASDSFLDRQAHGASVDDLVRAP
ncbi:proline dehydrogenase family protein [Patulibacter defluvii]|uniref:proline dehydrogenase family protein n=1 Tax=Patulibacter defluvii TaxID=3095358 RepID=UPI002A76340E|nr:proline dehydrogenase family protein [Patulibacter sp. DM4]